MLFYTMSPAHKQGSVSLEMSGQECKEELLECEECEEGLVECEEELVEPQDDWD